MPHSACACSLSSWKGRTMNDSAPISRRTFVGQSALAAAAAPFIVSARALGREDQPAASDRLALGFIGMGRQNFGHLGRFLNRQEVQVVAVCDVDTTRREEARSRVEKKYGDG